MRSVVAIVVVLCAGCASYTAPGGPAHLAEWGGTDSDIAAARQPAPQFPVRLGVIRVQGPGYRSHTSAGLGSGRYSVVATPDLLSAAQQRDLSQWPAVAAVAHIDPALLPDTFSADEDLRLAAAKMQADVLMVYTIDTTFHVQGHDLAPLANVSLKLVPDEDAYIGATATAVFLDVRTGYRYGSAQAAGMATGLPQAWGSAELIDAKRLEAEQQAFTTLLSEAEKTWAGIATRYQ